MRTSESKIRLRSDMKAERDRLKQEGKPVVFTNGCFDLLHAGHVSYLEFARRQGDVLVVGVNSDASVKRAKGEKRPLTGEQDRARLLGALECVDYVVIFDEDEPAALIAEIVPDILVKGEDWAHYVSGREVVEEYGGRVALAPLKEGVSTSDLIARIVEAYGDKETS